MAQAHNGRVIPSDASVAVGRFLPEGPIGYVANRVPNAPLRATRAEAVADWLAHVEAA